MRQLSFIVAIVVLLFAVPALAGQVSYIEGKGQWVHTGCTEPNTPTTIKLKPNTRANKLNAYMNEHNAFTSEAEAYMNCVSQEAQRDANAMNQLILGSAQAIINKTQADATLSGNIVRMHEKSDK